MSRLLVRSRDFSRAMDPLQPLIIYFQLLVAIIGAVGITVTYGQYPTPPPQQMGFQLPYLGLKGHKFFIPNPYAPKGAGMNDNILVRNQKRAKAVAVYFRNLLIGNPAFDQKLYFKFDPEEAKRSWQPEYIRKFGYRGQRLVDFLGSGPTKEQIVWSLGEIY